MCKAEACTMSNVTGLFAAPCFILSAPSSIEAIMGCSPVVEGDANALAGAIILQCYVQLHIATG